MVRDSSGDVWLSPKEAAQELGLSVGRIYQMKERLTHRKGDTPQSRVFFLKRTLFEDYINTQSYQHFQLLIFQRNCSKRGNHRQKCVKIEFFVIHNCLVCENRAALNMILIIVLIYLLYFLKFKQSSLVREDRAGFNKGKIQYVTSNQECVLCK